MARSKNQPADLAPDVAISSDVLSAATQMSEHSALIQSQFGDGLPYDRTRVVHEAQFYMTQSAEAMLEAGKRLIVLKEHEPHGEFTAIVEGQLGMAERTARLMMQAAVKYCSPQLESKRQALAVLGKTKMFELMTQGDEELAALADGGTVAGLELDDIERMTSRELKAALREAKENYQAQAGVLSDKNTKIDKLTTELRKVKRRSAEASPDEISGELQEEITRFAFVAEASIAGDLHNGIEALMEHSSMEGRDPRAFLAGILLQLDRRVNDIRVAFDIPLSVDADVRPDLAR